MVSVIAALDRLGKLANTRPVSKLAEAFQSAGHELALVGGPVRDAFLDKAAFDLDFTTSARPDEILQIVKPIASAHWDIGRAFGTIGAVVAGETVEITTYRADSYQSDSRKPEVVFGDTLLGDLVRRDFTVNAIALKLPELTLVDCGTGVEDLLSGVLRTPSSAEISFTDDPLRMLRAARFTAQLGFRVASDAIAAIEKLADRLQVVSAERIRDEFSKLMQLPNPGTGIELLVATGLADRFLPELPAMRLEVDTEHQHKDVYQHSLQVLDQAIELEASRRVPDRPDLILRLAALLHDIGKPATRRLGPGGQVSFYHHDVVGAKLARKRLRELKFEKQQIEAVCLLIELHLRFFGYSENAWTDSAVRRYVRDAGAQLERLHILTRSDVTSRNRRKAERLAHAYDDLERRIAEIAETEELAAIRPELDGEQIMRLLELPPGPEVGEAYRWLLELRLDAGLLGEAEVTRRLLDWWNNR